jgi:hypothetical protein
MKKNIKKNILYIILVNCLIIAVSSQNGDAKRDFGYGSMEIFEFKSKTRQLQVADINGDGKDDILFLNNQASRLEILLRKKKSLAKANELPQLKESFYNRGLMLDYWVNHFRVARINKDKLLDIVAITSSGEINIYFQKSNGEFDDPLVLKVDDKSDIQNFVVGDLNQNGLTDLVICKKNNAEIIWNDKQQKFNKRKTIKFSVYGCQGVMLIDVNHDKRDDLLFYFGENELPVRLRLNKGNGGFSWERALKLPDISYVEKSLLKKNHDQLAVVMNNGMIFRLYDFVYKRSKSIFRQKEINSQRLILQGIGRGKKIAWDSYDINQDGFLDLCVAAPQLSQVHLYYGNANGFSSVPQTIDSLTSLNIIFFNQKGDLVVFSKKEKSIAIHKKSEFKKFPEFLRLNGEPHALAVSSKKDLFVVTSDKKKYRLFQFASNKGQYSKAKEYALDLKSAPESIKVFHLKKKNDFVVIMFNAYDKPSVYRVDNQKVSQLSIDKFRAAGRVLKEQDVVAAGQAGELELLVNEGKIVRAYRWQKNMFKIVNQLNPQKESVALLPGKPVIGKDKYPAYLLYDATAHSIYKFSRTHSIDFNVVQIADKMKNVSDVQEFKVKNQRGILLVGDAELQWIQDNQKNLTLKKRHEYASSLNKASMWMAKTVSTGKRKNNMLALLDSKQHTLELISLKKNKLKEELVFEVFQDSGFNNIAGKHVYEPHSLDSGDINGDKINDIAALVHNKLIIYYGE